MINKLSMVNGEDLHYFLPLFVPLKVGDSVNIEAFSSPDNGTIVSLWRNHEKNNIVYRIRSTENVFYIMNYYKLVNRAPPKDYWYKTRKNVLINSGIWNDVKLSNNKYITDPSDSSHPLHGVILALIESSKQAISCIESKNDNILEFEREQKDEKIEFEEENLCESKPNGLSHLIKFLKRNKLICNVQKTEMSTNYWMFCDILSKIIEEKNSNNNKVFLCHMTET